MNKRKAKSWLYIACALAALLIVILLIQFAGYGLGQMVQN
jgi:hypothetical protein